LPRRASKGPTAKRALLRKNCVERSRARSITAAGARQLSEARWPWRSSGSRSRRRQPAQLLDDVRMLVGEIGLLAGTIVQIGQEGFSVRCIQRWAAGFIRVVHKFPRSFP
jgi:hypothetical protein